MTEHKLIQLQAVYVTDEFIARPKAWPEWFDGFSWHVMDGCNMPLPEPPQEKS